MPSLTAVRDANLAFKRAYVPVAVFVGGTSGIGQAMVKALSSYLGGNIHLVIVGRNSSAAENTFASIPRPSDQDGKPVLREFLYCDAYLMKNIKAACAELNEKLNKINFLVLSAGYMEFTSRDETEEGLDKVVVMRYYSRFKFIVELLPLLQRASDAGEDAAAMSILGPAMFNMSIDVTDLDMKKHYSCFRSFFHTCVYNDVVVEEFSKHYPDISFTHIYPGLVDTPALAHAYKWWPMLFLKPVIRLLVYLFGVGPEVAAEYMLYALFNANKGWSRRSNLGDDSGSKNYAHHTEEQKRALWEHSVAITNV